MWWLAWRQRRSGAAVLVAALVVYVAVGLLEQVRQPHMDGMSFSFFGYLSLVTALFLAVPVLAREHERQTTQLSWTQSVTRSRWLWIQMAVVVGLAGVAVGALEIVMALLPPDPYRYAPPAVVAGYVMTPGYFNSHGVVPVAATLFLVAVALASGATLGRTLPCMGIVLAVWIAYGAVADSVRDTVMHALGTGGYWPAQLGQSAVLLGAVVPLVLWTARRVHHT